MLFRKVRKPIGGENEPREKAVFSPRIRHVEKPVKASEVVPARRTVSSEEKAPSVVSAAIEELNPVELLSSPATDNVHLSWDELELPDIDFSLLKTDEREYRRQLLDAEYVLPKDQEHPKAAPAADNNPPAGEDTEAGEQKKKKRREPKVPRKLFFRVASAVCMLFLVAVLLETAFAYVDTHTVSKTENRNLATQTEFSLKSWLNGDFQTETETFLSDHLFSRETLLSIAQWFENLIERDSDVKVQQGADLNAATENGDGGGSGDEATVDEADPQKYIIMSDRVVLAYEHNEPTLDYFVQCTQKLMDTVPSNIKKYVMMAPSRIDFETADVKEQSDDPKDDVQYVLGKFGKDITVVDAYSAVAAHAADTSVDDLFFHTDHHWTMLGAYYGAEEFFKAAGIDYTPIEKYQKKRGEDFLGYLYANYPSDTLENNPDKLYYYLLDGKSKKEVVAKSTNGTKTKDVSGYVVQPDRGGYYTFVGDTYATAIIEGNSKSDRTLMVVSESYAQALAPWLADNFKEVIIIDPRYYHKGNAGLQDLIKSEGVTDFMVLDSDLSLPYATSSTLESKLAE